MPSLEEIHQIYKSSKCLYTQHQVEVAIDKVALAVEQQLVSQNPLILCVMVGGLVFAGRLIPRLNFPLTIDYIHATRYHGAIHGRELQWKMKPTTSLNDRTVLIVDDILDGGITLAAIVEYCRIQQAKHIYTTVLVDKLSSRDSQGLVCADYTALTVEQGFVFGYGMDYQQYLRNAPGIYVLPSHVD